MTTPQDDPVATAPERDDDPTAFVGDLVADDTNEYTGPYDPARGLCADGHPVNPYGRCEPLNDAERPAEPEPAPEATP